MKKINLVIALGFILGVIAIVFLVERLRNYDGIIVEQRARLFTAEYKLKRYHEKFTQNIYSDNKIVDDIFVYKKGNKGLLLSNFINKALLVYRFSEESCRACVIDDLEIIKQLSDSIGSDNILVVTRMTDTRKMEAMLSVSNISVPYCNYNEEIGLSLECDTLKDSPFFFVVKKDLRVRFPYKTDDGHSIQSPYFKRIIEYFREEV